MTKRKQNELAYETLKAAIVNLLLKPGEFLNMAQLVDRYQLGRTPINHALHRLSLEKLVRIIPRKGIVVTPISVEEALDVIQVRTVNEVLCVRLAARNITDAQLEELESIQRRYRVALGARDRVQLLDADRRFHETLAEASGNSALPEVLAGLHARAQRFWALSLDIEHHGKDVDLEHNAIITALASRDEQAAVIAIEAHIDSFKNNFIKKVPKKLSAFT